MKYTSIRIIDRQIIDCSPSTPYLFSSPLCKFKEAQTTEYSHPEVSLQRENRKVVFTKIGGGHILSKCPKERHSPPWNIKFQYVFRGVTASL
jgi:hypothetical protein